MTDKQIIKAIVKLTKSEEIVWERRKNPQCFEFFYYGKYSPQKNPKLTYNLILYPEVNWLGAGLKRKVVVDRIGKFEVSEETFQEIAQHSLTESQVKERELELFKAQLKKDSMFA